jgi:RNA polymerase-associated protein LEO1
VPKFLNVDPVAFTLQQFQPPEDPNAKDGKPSPDFSAYETAMSTIRWRHCPSNPEELQSNARILRWSDGSLTLQLASDPQNQYAIQADRLAPRQINPKKPTPVSMIDKSGRTGRPYHRNEDASAYLFSPSFSSVALRATNKLTASLTVQPNTKKNDEALLRLQQSTAAANKTIVGEGGKFKLEETLEDPEMARKRAEQAEREKQKAQRRAESMQARAISRNATALGRVGLGRSAGLSAADLEGDELGTGYGRRAAARPRRRANRRGDRSESEEADYEDEDDEGFIAKDDEEEEEEEDSGEEDELERQEAAIEKYEQEQRTPKKPGAGLKRSTPEVGDEAADPVGQGSPMSRQKRRRVIEEDEDE